MDVAGINLYRILVNSLDFDTDAFQNRKATVNVTDLRQIVKHTNIV